MKEKTLFVLIVALCCCVLSLQAQDTGFYGNQVGISCQDFSMADDGYSEKIDALIVKILNEIGATKNFEVLSCQGVETCKATVHLNVPVIVYDPAFLNKFNSGFGFTNGRISQNKMDWIALTVLAHEVGHHVNQHLINEYIRKAKTPRQLELEADEFAGFVLCRLGATLNQAQRVMYSDLVPKEGSYSHPPRQDRLAAIQKGWKKANCKGAPPSPTKSEVANDLELAYKYNRQKDYDKTFELLYKHRNSLHFTPKAQNSLGFKYQKGLGVSQDYGEAKKWYVKAANQGNAKAQNNLGYLYEKGLGVSQDYGEAKKWYLKAANQGNTYGQNNLGLLYRKGLGVSQDYGEAKKWYLKAANQGYAKAQYNLGYLYEYGYGVSKDIEQAVQWYQKSAREGLQEAKDKLKKLGRTW